MKKQIACFGVRDYEIPYFEELGKKYGTRTTPRFQSLLVFQVVY